MSTWTVHWHQLRVQSEVEQCLCDPQRPPVQSIEDPSASIFVDWCHHWKNAENFTRKAIGSLLGIFEWALLSIFEVAWAVKTTRQQTRMRQSGTDMVGGPGIWENRNLTSMSGVQSPFMPRSSTLALMARSTCNQNIVVKTKNSNTFSLTWP